MNAQTATCPDSTAHQPQCADDRHDDRGDCDGNIYQYTATTYILGARPGEQVQMCSSHGQQATRKGEARRQS